MQTRRIIHILSALGLLAGLVTMPIAGQAAILGSISGTVTYSGDQDPNHDVIIAAHLSLGAEPVDSTHINGPGEYTLADLPDGSYYISAFLDLNDSGGGPPDDGEPEGWYDANGDQVPDTVTVSGNDITGIDIDLEGGADPGGNAIEGTVCYLGGTLGPGPLIVGLHDNINNAPLTTREVALPCGDYAFSDGPSGTYYVSLLYDADDSGGEPGPDEPFGWYDANEDGEPDPINYSGTLISGVDITLGTLVHYVDFSAGGAEDGTSWEDAFTDLQVALSAAGEGEEIWVAAGIYTPGAAREDSFILQRGVAVYGGFNGTEMQRNERNWRANVTVLSGEIGDPGTPTDNAYHVVTTASTYEYPLDQNAILDGFTLTAGYANGWGTDQDKGGALLNDYGHPTLANLNFVGNYAMTHGGALANQNNNTPLMVVNSTFSGNSTDYNGGAIFNNGAHILVVNSSFVGNTGANGGGIVNIQGSSAEVHNAIFWGNQAAQIANQDISTATVTYSLIEGGYASGTQILTVDPQLVDPDGPDSAYGTLDDDLHLGVGSPAIDAGDNGQLPADLADSDGDSNTSEDTPLDLDSSDRRVDDPIVSDTGSGSAPLVDMGADEYAPVVAIGGLSAVAGTALQAGTPSVLAARVTAGSHIQYQWDFGDGSSGIGGAAQHVYPTAGVYQVVVTATNSLGTQLASLSLSVEDDLSFSPGGTQTTSDGTLTFEIPASATGAVTITYTPQVTTTQALGDYQFAGLSFHLSATDEGGDPIIEPGEAFTLTLQYDERALPTGMDESSLGLYRYDEGTTAWIALTVLSRDPANDTLTVLLDHFSEFALLGNEPQHVIYLPMVVK